MAARGQLHFFVGVKLHFSRYEDVQVIFLKVLLKFKWPPRINFNFLVGAKTQQTSQKLFTF